MANIELELHFPSGYYGLHGRLSATTSADGSYVLTIDGARYDLQAAGEFVAARSTEDDLEFQLRMEPYGKSNSVSVTTAIAARIAGTRVFVEAAWPLVVTANGSRLQLEQQTEQTLEGGGKIVVGNQKLFLVWPDDSTLTIELSYGTYLSAYLSLAESRRGKVSGLYGNFDGERDNDMVTAAGETLVLPMSFENTYEKFATSWRVAANESLFEYAAGQSADSFNLRDFPAGPATADALPDAVREQAQRVCVEAGITEAVILEACIVDVGFGGDNSFALAAVGAQNQEFRSGTAATLGAPSTVAAGSDVQVEWTGPNNEGDFVTIVARGARDRTFGTYGYTSTGSPLAVRAPDEPGEYELRYLDGLSRTALASRPIEVAAVTATLEAPVEVIAGEEFEVHWTGPDNQSDFITIVARGARDGMFGNYAYTRGGSPLAIRAPDEPGEYELRYLTGRGRSTLASRTIAIR